MANPYDTNNFPGKFEIVYEGKAEAFHVFRIVLRGHKGMDSLMFKTEVTNWMMGATNGEWFVGNGFTASKKYPAFPYQNANGTDCFVLMDSLVDVVRFENRFPVNGFTPTLLS